MKSGGDVNNQCSQKESEGSTNLSTVEYPEPMCTRPILVGFEGEVSAVWRPFIFENAQSDQ